MISMNCILVLKNREHVDLKCLGKKKIKRWFSQFVDDEKNKKGAS